MTTKTPGGFNRSDSQWIPSQNLSFAQSAVTASGAESAGLDLGALTNARLTCAISNIGGTAPSYTISLDTSPDNATWTSVGTFGAQTANGSAYKSFANLDRYIRFSWTVSGTSPTASITVSGYAVGGAIVY